MHVRAMLGQSERRTCRILGQACLTQRSVAVARDRDDALLRRRSLRMNHVWCVEFIHDRDARGQALEWLSVVDKFTRKRVALEVRRSMTAQRVAEVLID